MTKTFEQLQDDAKLEEFVQEVGLENDKKDIKDTAPKPQKEIEPMEIVVRKFDLLAKGMRAEAKEVNFEEAEARFLAKGNFEEVMTQGQHADQVKEEWSQEISMMWDGITAGFGDPIKFVGSPFEKVKDATKLSEIIECLELAQEYLTVMLEEDDEEQEEQIEEQAEIEQ